MQKPLHKKKIKRKEATDKLRVLSRFSRRRRRAVSSTGTPSPASQSQWRSQARCCCTFLPVQALKIRRMAGFEGALLQCIPRQSVAPIAALSANCSAIPQSTCLYERAISSMHHLGASLLVESPLMQVTSSRYRYNPILQKILRPCQTFFLPEAGGSCSRYRQKATTSKNEKIEQQRAATSNDEQRRATMSNDEQRRARRSVAGTMTQS